MLLLDMNIIVIIICIMLRIHGHQMNYIQYMRTEGSVHVLSHIELRLLLETVLLETAVSVRSLG